MYVYIYLCVIICVCGPTITYLVILILRYLTGPGLEGPRSCYHWRIDALTDLGSKDRQKSGVAMFQPSCKQMKSAH